MIYEHRGKEAQRVVAIEYQDDRPAAVMTARDWNHGGKSGTSADYYDFEWCERDQALYFELIGGGPLNGYSVARFAEPQPPKAKLWLAPDISVQDAGRDEKTISNAELLAMGYEIINEPLLLDSGWGRPSTNPFDHAESGGCLYCRECDDWLPEDEMCQHLDWCDECGMWVYGADGTYNDGTPESKCNHSR